MKNDIVEVVEQFGSVCVDCLAVCLCKPPSDIGTAVRQHESLKLTIGTCRRCQQRSGALVEATGRLRNRLETAASWAAAAVVVGPIALPMLALGKIINQFADPSLTSLEGRRAIKERSKIFWSRRPSGLNTSIPRLKAELTPVQNQDAPKPQPINAEWLDAKRRFIIRALNKIDKGYGRDEAFAMRVQRLRKEGRLSPDVANSIRTITALRNDAVYREYELAGTDCQRVRTASLVVDTWAQKVGAN